MKWAELAHLLPIGIVLATALAVVFLDLVLARKDRFILPWLALSGFVLALLSLAQTQSAAWTKLLWFAGHGFQQDPRLQKTLIFGGAFCVDHFGMLIWGIACLAGALCVLSSSKEVQESALSSGEYYGLILLAVAGMMLLAVSHEFLTLLLSLEVMSVATYILAGSLRQDVRSNEAALKYLILGAFSTAFLLMGMAFYLGVFGTLSLSPNEPFMALVRKNLEEADARFLLLLFGMGLLLVGVFFKVGATPFHFWVPDVYQGAPTPITGLMAVGVKAAAFAFLARLAFGAFGGELFRAYWVPVAEIVAILTMIIGNLLAMRQDNVKRMLAYSAIAHTGYLLLAFLLNSQASGGNMVANLESVVFYLLAYGVMTLGAFGVVGLLRENGQPLEDIDSFRGLGKESPGVALCMATFMLSLAGLPPLAGFFAKFMIFRDAVNQGFIIAAVIGILTSVASLYYYLRVVVAMYMSPVGEAAPAQPKVEYSWGASLLIFLAGAVTLLLGVLPSVIMNAWAAGQ